MTAAIAIVYHSGYGHTAKQAQAVAEGARRVAGAKVDLIGVEDLGDDAPAWATLDAADAIIFGAPTYMGGASAPFKAFQDATSKRWMSQAWKNKLAAGFTNSGSHSGDKLNTLVGFVILAAQHGMHWLSLGLMPGNNSSQGSPEDLNRIGAYLGAMAQSNIDAGADLAPPKADLETAAHLGERVAKAAIRWRAGKN
ncbi:MAG: flavodoxin family protein [Pseudomonadota bacterium]